MSAYICLEGGGSGPDSKDLDIRCRAGFRRLLEDAKFTGRMPQLVAAGGRAAVYDHFVWAHSKKMGTFVAMWIDSEEPVVDIELTWKHLENVTTVPVLKKPEGAIDEQVLFMTTCMETWIVADRDALRSHYGANLQESALPSTEKLEEKTRHEVQDKLTHATRDCSNAYKKGKRSYEVLGKLTSETLEAKLDSFKRVRRILKEKL